MGIFGILVFVIEYPIAVYKHVSFSAYLSMIGTEKNECLALFLPLTVVWVLCLLFSVALFLAGAGIRRLNEWGRKILIALIIIEMIWILGDFIFAKMTLDFLTIIEVIAMLGLLFYFTRPYIKEQFK